MSASRLRLSDELRNRDGSEIDSTIADCKAEVCHFDEYSIDRYGGRLSGYDTTGI